ncbi:hypothetical protein COV19_05165 [Candidatus Woesearchaeota archaeon CG10_big_fil_rev_8_21_14_0_10_44_13]|nr:MAG: hypothetical protein COV19_05165 [Candidatus Woesearchaeota archaeon CG10_big_fil_rev_8_21_14_0_10_44_13]
MKKILILLFTLFLLIGVLGCEKKPSTVIGSNNNQPVAAGNDTEAPTGTQPVVDTSSPAKDLNVERVYWSTVNPELRVPTDLKIIVVNVGREAIDGFDYNIRITKDGTEWKDETKTYGDILYPNNKTRIELTYTFESEGKYRAEIFVDKDNKIGEKNRFNNVALSPDANAKPASSTPSGSGSSSDEDTDSSDTGSCSDSDSGKDEFTKGECDDGISVLGISDYCASSTIVKEYYCDADSRCKTQNMECDDGCEDGACI